MPTVAMSSVESKSGVQVIERAARILRELADHPEEGLSLSQITERVGLARSTVHRLVGALEAERFVVAASPTGRVKLGPGLASLAVAATPDLVRDVRPFIARLSRELNETVDFSVLQHDHVLFVDQVVAPRRLNAVSATGTSFPAHCPANGKALLATLSDEQLIHLLPERLEQLTPNTITDRKKLLAELDEVRRTGIAYDREEHTIGIRGLGCVVRDGRGHMGSISVPLPSQRFYGNEARLTKKLLQTCEEMTRALSS
jgi:DNA-binding IclR family transcriptional regulator